MNIIISVFFIVSIVFSFISKTESSIFTIITNSLNECGALVIRLMFITAFYSGLMKAAQDT